MNIFENKIIKLVEERGYMGTKYRPFIKQMIKYIREYIYDNEKNTNNGWYFLIPKSLTKKIDCVINLEICINIQDKNLETTHNIGANNTIFSNNRIIDNKLEKSVINIYGYSVGNQLLEKLMYGCFSHEFNHLLETHKRMLKKETSISLYKRAVSQNIIKNKTFSNNLKYNNFVREIFYRLIFKNELNALINSVYGDLDYINSQRENFKDDLKKTQAYEVFDYINKNISILDNLTNEEWKKINECFKIICYTNSKRYSDINFFKNSFKKEITIRLNDLIKGIGRVASYFYDCKEEPLIDDFVIQD